MPRKRLPEPSEQNPSIPLKESPAASYPSALDTLTTELMTATKRGDTEAFDRLTLSIRGRAFRAAHSLVGSREDALEMCQEAFLKTYRARDSYRDGEPFLPWFHRILRNTCFSFLRKRGRVKKTSISGSVDDDQKDREFEADAPLPSGGAELSEAMGVFRQAFERLLPMDREVLNLRHFEELSYREIAQTLEIPEGTVMSRLFHARRRLRELLTPHLDGALEDFAPAFPESPKDGGGAQ